MPIIDPFEAQPQQRGIIDPFEARQPEQLNITDPFDTGVSKKAAPEESGIWTTAADFAKKMLGPAISGVAGLPLGTEEALKGAVRKSAEGEIDASVPVPLAIARALGKSAERLMPGSTTEEQRSLATQRALASLPEIPGARALNTFGKNVQESIEDSISAQTQQAVKESEITGNIFKGEIDFGSNPTVRGYAMQAASVLGSMGPVIAAAIVTKSPTAAGVTGGTMAAGEAANTAADYINKLPHEKLLTASPFYASMIAGGASEEEARKLTINKAAETGAVLQGERRVGEIENAGAGREDHERDQRDAQPSIGCRPRVHARRAVLLNATRPGVNRGVCNRNRIRTTTADQDRENQKSI